MSIRDYMPERISCHKCKFFYVTWDRSFPFGCKAMEFKGKIMPSLAVFQASGTFCQSFEQKHTKTLSSTPYR